MLTDAEILETFPVTELICTGANRIIAKIDTADLHNVLAVSTRWRARWSDECHTFYVRACRAGVWLQMKPNDRVMQLCAQIQDEQNHAKLTKLLDELCELLDQSEQERERIGAQSCVVIKAKAS